MCEGEGEDGKRQEEVDPCGYRYDIVMRRCMVMLTNVMLMRTMAVAMHGENNNPAMVNMTRPA